MKNFNTKEYYTGFSNLLFSTVYSFGNPDYQLAMLNKLILDCIDRDTTLTRTKFTRPPAPWMKQLNIIELQKQRDKYRFLYRFLYSYKNIVLKPSDKTLEADTNELNKYFNQTGKRLTTIKPHSNELKYLIGSFPHKNNGFQLQTVSYEDVEQCLRLPRSDMTTYRQYL